MMKTKRIKTSGQSEHLFSNSSPKQTSLPFRVLVKSVNALKCRYEAKHNQIVLFTDVN